MPPPKMGLGVDGSRVGGTNAPSAASDAAARTVTGPSRCCRLAALAAKAPRSFAAAIARALPGPLLVAAPLTPLLAPLFKTEEDEEHVLDTLVAEEENAILCVRFCYFCCCSFVLFPIACRGDNCMHTHGPAAQNFTRASIRARTSSNQKQKTKKKIANAATTRKARPYAHVGGRGPSLRRGERRGVVGYSQVAPQ